MRKDRKVILISAEEIYLLKEESVKLEGGEISELGFDERLKITKSGRKRDATCQLYVNKCMRERELSLNYLT